MFSNEARRAPYRSYPPSPKAEKKLAYHCLSGPGKPASALQDRSQILAKDQKTTASQAFSCEPIFFVALRLLTWLLEILQALT